MAAVAALGRMPRTPQPDFARTFRELRAVGLKTMDSVDRVSTILPLRLSL